MVCGLLGRHGSDDEISNVVKVDRSGDTMVRCDCRGRSRLRRLKWISIMMAVTPRLQDMTHSLRSLSLSHVVMWRLTLSYIDRRLRCTYLSYK
jgi:hypothetical protein